MTLKTYETISLALQSAIIELEYRLDSGSIAPHLMEKNQQRLEDLKSALKEFMNGAMSD